MSCGSHPFREVSVRTCSPLFNKPLFVGDSRTLCLCEFATMRFGVTLSLPSIVGGSGIVRVLQPRLSAEERKGLNSSAENLRRALKRIS